MVCRSVSMLVLALGLTASSQVRGQGVEKPATPLDEVTLKNGSKIFGKIKEMTDETLVLEDAFAATDGVIKIKFSEVADLKSGGSIPVALDGGTTLKGNITGIRDGQIVVKTDELSAPTSVALSRVKAINPPPVKQVSWRGSAGLGATVSDGNTNNRTVSGLGELELRALERHRVTLRAGYNYADNNDGVTLRNGFGSIKYDFFITKRFYVYVGALFEHDGFQDLALRTALSAGPGYQFIDKGDFSGENFREMQLYGEAGLAYFSENHRRAPDDEFVSARWAVKFDWPILPKQVTLFHYHEGFPGLERAKDLYVTTQQGVRFNIWQGFVATFQVNWKWDNTPTPGFERDDTLYIATIGYSFEG